MICPSVHGDNPRALACGLSSVQVDNHDTTVFLPPTSVETLYIVRYFMLKLVRIVVLITVDLLQISKEADPDIFCVSQFR